MASATDLVLFDDVVRVDPRPKLSSESSYAFLNRVKQPFWDRVRRVHERWFVDYPGDRLDVCRRFRASDPAQHYGAWWELYLATLFTRLGYDIETHPEIDGVTSHPDFRMVDASGSSFLVEATLVHSGISVPERSAAREAWIVDPINELEHPLFSVGLTIDQPGVVRPGPKSVVAGILDWLNGLNPDDVDPTDRPEQSFAVHDWVFTLTAYPVRTDARGRHRYALIGRPPLVSGFQDDTRRLRRSLRAKAKKYGRPNEPLLIAVLMMSGSVEDTDIYAALLGDEVIEVTDDTVEPKRRPNGFWVTDRGPRGTRVSGILMGTTVLPWSLTGALPVLWRHPAATHPAPSGLPFGTKAWDEHGEPTTSGQTMSGADVFGLPPEWPGPDRPFPRVR